MGAGWLDARNAGRQLTSMNEKLRGKVSHEVLYRLHSAAERLLAGDTEEGLQYFKDAFSRYRDETEGGHEYEGPPPTTKQGVEDEMRRILGGGRREQRMKKAEKKRQDSEPTVTYDEPVEMIYEVENRLKAVAKALKRLIKKQAQPTIAEDLHRIEKQAHHLTTGCC